MNKQMALLLSFTILVFSCRNEKVNTLSAAQKKALLDSVIREEQKEIREMEVQSLRDRMSIELKEKTDSILAAREKNRPAVKIVPPIVPTKDSIDATQVLIKDTTTTKSTL